MPSAQYGTKAYYREIGRRGGKATYHKHGRKHFVKIGKLGFQAMVDKWFLGDRAAAIAWFVAKGLFHTDGGGINYRRIWFDPGPHPAHFEDPFPEVERVPSTFGGVELIYVDTIDPDWIFRQS